MESVDLLLAKPLDCASVPAKGKVFDELASEDVVFGLVVPKHVDAAEDGLNATHTRVVDGGLADLALGDVVVVVGVGEVNVVGPGGHHFVALDGGARWRLFHPSSSINMLWSMAQAINTQVMCFSSCNEILFRRMRCRAFMMPKTHSTSLRIDSIHFDK